MMSRLQKKTSEIIIVLAVFALLLITYHGIYADFFLTTLGTIGHDFGLSLASYVDGFIWFARNGLWAVPWFTPSFCGGQPFFADPQSGYYSFPQWLTFLTDPLTANYLALLLFASAGFFGAYLLGRRFFGLSVGWGSLAAALYFFNGFLPHRMIVGETGYHALSLAPWLALALLAPAANRIATIGLAILAGAIAAYWLQSGLTTLMVPASLSIALVLLVYRLHQSWPSDLPLRLLAAIGISVALSASKLVASLSFYSRFERTQYLLPGFDNPLSLLGTNLLALFGPSELAELVASSSLVNVQWSPLPHEWAYGFTLTPILIILVARRVARVNSGATERNAGTVFCSRRGRLHTVLIGVAITLLALVPLALQIYTPALNAWYKSLPLIGATAWPMRWLVVYLPVLPIATVLIARNALGDRQDKALWLVGAAIIVLIGLNLAESRRYYLEQPYRPDALLDGYSRLAAGAVQTHRIHSIGIIQDPRPDARISNWSRNDLVVNGVSQAKCYNPSFGYRLEKFPMGTLEVGDAMSERDGYLNIKNPACYVFPEENGCEPGDHFRVDQRAEAEAFVSYRPFPFAKSTKQRIADLVTIVSLAATATFLLLVWPWWTWHRRRAVDR